MLFGRRHHAVIKNILNNKREPDDFEKYVLVPEIRARLEHLNCELERLKAKAMSPDTLHILELALVQEIDQKFLNGSSPRDRAKTFLAEIVSQIEKDFQGRIKAAAETSDKVESYNDLCKFLQEANYVFSMIVQLKSRLFRDRLKSVVLISKRAGDELYSEVEEKCVTLAPFVAGIDEMFSIASSSSISIDHWMKQCLEHKNSRLQYLSQETQVLANTQVFWIQLLGVLLAFALGVIGLMWAEPVTQALKEPECQDNAPL